MRMSAEEYVAYELASDERHEFHEGRVYAVAGASREHNLIALNVVTRLRAAARGGPCRVFMEGMRLALPSGPQYYPDVMVACEPPPADRLVETAPCVLVEVLSPSTRGIDIGRKLPLYRTSPSVEAVVLVRQTRRWVEFHRRNADGTWTLSDHIGAGEVTFPCPGAPNGPVTMTLDEIYEDVVLGPEADEG